jgi:hypothetical protein
MTSEDRGVIRGALDLLEQKIERHDYGPTFTYEEARQLRRDALQKIASARAAITTRNGKS